MFNKLSHLDRLKFGKDPTIYIFENNLNNSTQIDNTLVFQSIIKDDKISLVNEEFYTKATRNHLAKENLNVNRTNITNKSKNFNTKLQNLSNASLKFKNRRNESESPKFNQYSNEENIYKDNELDLTFKHSQQNLHSSDNFQQTRFEEMKFQIENLKLENENLTKTILELEEKSAGKTNENKQILNNLDQLNEELGKLNAKHNALLIYASDIQKKLDLIEMEASNKQDELNRLLSSDWGKIILENESLIKILQKEIKYYKEESENKIKTFANEKNFDNNNNNNNNRNTNTRLENLVDSYIQEIKFYKRITDDYKSRENECNKKWNELIKENNSNIEKINLLQLQLDKQSSHINNIIIEYDMRVLDALNKIPKFLEGFDEKKSEAAEYLVEQMNFVMDEKRRIIEDNFVLENNLEMANFEIDKLKRENKNLLAYFEDDEYDYQIRNQYENSDDVNSNLKPNLKLLYMKIEELQDVLTQYKNLNSPSAIVNIEQSFVELKMIIAERDNKIEELQQRLKDYLNKTNLVFDESQAIKSISNALSEKDIIIVNLRNQLMEMNNKTSENQKNNSSFTQLTERNFNPENFIEKIEKIS